jgi:hypothetical protein
MIVFFNMHLTFFTDEAWFRKTRKCNKLLFSVLFSYVTDTVVHLHPSRVTSFHPRISERGVAASFNLVADYVWK